MRTVRRSLMCIALLLLAGTSPAASVQQSLTFQSLDQSMWAPGDAGGPSKHTLYLIDPATARWNFASSGYPGFVGPYWSEDTYLFGVVEFGAQGRAASSGALGLWFDVTVLDTGSVDVTYSATPQITFPEVNSFRAGDTVLIETSQVAGSAQMTTTSPQFQLDAKGSIELSGAAEAKLCLFGCTPPFGIPQFDIGHQEFTIFSAGAGSCISTSSLPVDVSSYIPEPSRICAPNINTSASGSGGDLVSAGSHDFLSLTLDASNIAFKLAKSPIPANWQKDWNGVSVGYNVLTVRPNVTLTAAQNFRFHPDLRVKLQFGQPLEHYVVTAAGAVGPATTASSVEVSAGDKIWVTYPSADKQPTDVDPTISLANQFTSETHLGSSESVALSAGSINVHVPSVELFPELCFPSLEIAGVEIIPAFCTPSVHTPAIDENSGNLYANSWSTAQSLNVYSNSWTLQGFTPVTINAFALDPENPIILLTQQTGASRNLGGGRRQVAYAIDFSNGGDVALYDVHVQADLAGAYSAAHKYTVDKVLGCDASLNANFNGDSDKNLLAAGTTLDVGAKGRVILIVSVWPKPDPPVYALASNDDGTSALTTNVKKSASSDVLLGPGIIGNAKDFVLFGDQFVKLDSIGDTFGHVGANDFIEVKNGASGIVAGDLRAGRVVRVQGSITADYAFAGSIVDVVRPAKLTLSGNIKNGASVATYALDAPAPATALQGNVWVPDNQSQALPPGHYGDVTVNANATLALQPGTYWFHRLVVANGASLSAKGRTRQTTVHVLDPGEVRIGQDARIRGILNAPRANVTFEERSRLDGAAAARSITLRPGAAAAYHVDCDPLVDPDCDGTPNCGKF